MLFSRRGRGTASPTYAQVTTEDEEAGDDIKWRPAARPAPSTPLPKFLYTLAKRLAVIAIVIVVLKLLPSIKPIRRGIRVLVNYPQQVALRTTEEMFEHAGPRSRALAGVADGKFRHWLRGVQDAHGAYPEGQFSSGAGIVFCGGGASMLRQVMGQILYLRETLGCTLPVEVMHLGEDEMTDGWRAALQALPDTRVVDLYSLIDPLTQEPVTRPVGSFTHVKPAVVLLSSFEEVIFLDTNNYAMIDPAELLLRDQYKRDGYLMWSDLWLSTSIAHEYAVYSLLQVPPPPGFENSESGVMYWDKRRRWKELVTAWALAKPLAARGTIDGDKQMYGFAFAATGQTLTHTFPRAGVVGMLRPTHALHLPGTRSVSFQPLGIHQPDPADGGPGFFHSMGFTKSLRPFSRRGVSHVLNVAGAEADPGFTMLDLSTSHSPYGLGRAVAMDAARQERLLTGLPAGVRARAQAARDVSDDPRVVAAFGVDHPDFALTALSWFMGRS